MLDWLSAPTDLLWPITVDHLSDSSDQYEYLLQRNTFAHHRPSHDPVENHVGNNHPYKQSGYKKYHVLHHWYAYRPIRYKADKAYF